MSLYTLIEKHTKFGGWYAQVLVGGQKFYVSLERGKAVRIPYKPKGQNKGFKWYGTVRTATGRDLWRCQVNKNSGIRGMLRDAGLFPPSTPEEIPA